MESVDLHGHSDTTDDRWASDLQNMQRVVEIFELLGGKNEPLVANLVTPYRRWVKTEDVMLREAPFSANSKVPHRVYLFRDLILIGKFKEPNKVAIMNAAASARSAALSRDAAASNADETASVASGLSKKLSFRLSFSRRKSSSAPTDKGASSFNRPGMEDSYKVKLVHYLPLESCSIHSINPLDNTWGLKLSHVSRIKEEIDGKKAVKTKVEMLELWFNSKENRDSMEHTIGELTEEILDSDMSRAQPSLSTVSDGSVIVPGERSWAKNRPKVARSRTRDFDGRSRGGSGDSEETAITSQAGGISLADLEQRYQVDFAQKSTPENTTRYRVEFGEGQMGFSLSSGQGIGVIIGKLARQSFADMGGCEIGDRLESVNGVDIDVDTTWQHAVEIIKAAGRPVTLGFVRNVQVQAQVKDGMAAKAKSSDGKRRWAANRARIQSGHGSMVRLEDIEQLYKSTAVRDPALSIRSEDGKDDDDIVSTDEEDARTYRNSEESVHLSKESAQLPSESGKAILEAFAAKCSTEEERNCVAVLKEILQTEKAYILNLRALIANYMMPCQKKTRRKKCRELESASIVCDHGGLRSNCSKPSAESGPLLSADDFQAIFMNVVTIMKINSELLKAIEDGLSAIRDQDIEDITDGLTRIVEVFSTSFVQITPFFTMYALYCHQYLPAIERLAKLRAEEEDFDTWLRQSESRSSTSLRSHLIKPVQRIMRYPLLFQELLKRVQTVEEASPDTKKVNIHMLVEVIHGTAKKVEKIASDVQQKVEVQDTIGSIMNVFHELGGADDGGDENIKANLLAPSRRFVRFEDIFFREPPFDSEYEPCRLYLFNDLIILAAEKDSSASGSHTLTKRKTQSFRSRGKSLGNLVSGMLPQQADSGGQTEFPAWTYQPIHWIELHSGTIQPLSKPDETGWYGFRLKSIKRTVAAPPTNGHLSKNGTLGRSTKRITWGAGVKESPPVQEKSGKVVTSIHKYEFWLGSRERLQQLISDIEDKINILSVLSQNASKGVSKFGAGHQKKTRSWMQKKASREDPNWTSGSRVSRKATAGSIDAQDALEAISKKYSGIGSPTLKETKIPSESIGKSKESNEN